MAFSPGEAAAAQSAGGKYKADGWSMVTIPAGERVWGGVPYPTEYFTDWASIAEFHQPGYSHAIWDALQVSPYADTVRGGLAEYEVLLTITVPSGSCQANGSFGVGGARQFMIQAWSAVLRPTGRTITFADADAKGIAAAVK